MGPLFQNLTINLQRYCAYSVDSLPLSDRHAAVLVPLYEGAEGGINVVLTQRSRSLRSHPGETCFPGGKRDPSDGLDDVSCALRETREELGIETDSLSVVGCLQPFLSKHFLSVTPVIAIIKDIREIQFKPNEEEVEHVFSVPLDMFLTSTDSVASYSSKDIAWGDIMCRMHAWEYTPSTRLQQTEASDLEEKSFLIWGLTAAILIHVASIGLNTQPTFDVVPPDDERYCLLSDIMVVCGDDPSSPRQQLVRRRT